MFPTYWRSVSGPIRHHVCRSRLTPRFAGHRIRSPQSYSTSFSHATPATESSQPDAGGGNTPGEPTSSSDHNDNASPDFEGQIPDSSIDPSSQGLQRQDASRRRLEGITFTSPISSETPTAESAQPHSNEVNDRGGDSPSGSEGQRQDWVAEENALQGLMSEHAKKRKPATKSVPIWVYFRERQRGRRAEAEKKKLEEIESRSGQIEGKHLSLTPLDIKTAPVPRLEYGLDRTLFNPGVYQLRDPRSRVFNFDPYLGSIMPVTEFDFESLKEYITSSKDKTLRNIAAKKRKKYIGSSSSMTSVLSHFHYLLSAWRPIDTRTVSQGFPEKLRNFTRLLRGPAAIFLRYDNGSYAIDADKEFDDANILNNLGKSMEKLLTLPKGEFERYRRSHENKISAEEEQATPESYHYTTHGDFLMRSQLDAYDPRLPGTGMFDLKTRAVVSIRMDVKNFERGIGYELKGRFGNFESYEREFFDMIRAAFLKYSLQARIGRMDGVFVAFHNIQRIFGFQYISVPEMDQTIHGQSDTTLGDTEFKLSLSLWNKILNKATAKFPGRSLRLHFETREHVTPTMHVFVEPVTEEQIHAIQTKNQEAIDAYQRRILNLDPKESSDEGDLPTEPQVTADEPEPQMGNNAAVRNDNLQSYDTMESFANNITVEHNKIYDSRQPQDNDFLSALREEDDKQSKNSDDLFALSVTVRNKVNSKLVTRPEFLTKDDTWDLEYDIVPMEGPQVREMYKMCQKRRQLSLQGRGEDESDQSNNAYINQLRRIAKEGRKFRAKEDERDRKEGIVVLGDQPR